ncbi:MAG: polyketide cyclase, partial [Dokdonella sp.]
WIGQNKVYELQLQPSANGKTLKIQWSYDVDYGWNLMDRFGGLYINGDPAQTVQLSLNNLAALLAGFPNVDYKEQQIDVVDVAAKPVFLVEAKSKRSLDDVAEATNIAMTEIQAAMAKAGVTAVGPRMTITTSWGDEDYTFSVAVPVSASVITLDGQSYTLTTPVPAPPAADTAEPVTPVVLNPGEKDRHGLLVIDATVRGALWYQGKALVSEYTGSPAALPLLRVNQKAYAETHGYRYNDTGIGRPWDELTSAPDAAEDQQTFKVYLPIEL